MFLSRKFLFLLILLGFLALVSAQEAVPNLRGDVESENAERELMKKKKLKKIVKKVANQADGTRVRKRNRVKKAVKKVMSKRARRRIPKDVRGELCDNLPDNKACHICMHCIRTRCFLDEAIRPDRARCGKCDEVAIPDDCAKFFA